VDYLRAGGSPAPRRCLVLAADQFCGTAQSEAEVEEALALLEDLHLSADLGVRLCRRRERSLRCSGDILGCLRWACRAECCGASARGFYVSEVLDILAEEDLPSLLLALTPPEYEPLVRYPPDYLLEKLGLTSRQPLPPSGRMYFFVQYARCRALHEGGRPPADYAPTLVRLLNTGSATPALTRAIIQEELMPALTGNATPLTSDEALMLMRFVQSIRCDPFQRVQLKVDLEELHRALGTCLSQAILRGPGVLSTLMGPTDLVPTGVGLTA